MFLAFLSFDIFHLASVKEQRWMTPVWEKEKLNFLLKMESR